MRVGAVGSGIGGISYLPPIVKVTRAKKADKIKSTKANLYKKAVKVDISNYGMKLLQSMENQTVLITNPDIQFYTKDLRLIKK